MKSCEGCSVASIGYGFSVLRCTETEGCALEELREKDPKSHLLENTTCGYERLSHQVQNAIDKPPLIL